MSVLESSWHWVLWVAIIGASLIVVRALTRRSVVKYQKRDHLYGKSTLRLWSALSEAGEGDWLVHPRMDVKRLLKSSESRGDRPGSDDFGSWELDFVLLDPDGGEPLAGIYVNRHLGQEDDGDDSDDALESRLGPLLTLLDSIDLPLLVVERQPRYRIEELRSELDDVIEYPVRPKRRRRTA